MNRLRRRPGWQGDLGVYLQQCEARAFAWGEFDCALFAADWVLRLTGFDAAAEYRGRYRTAGGAARRLKAVTGGGLAEAATQALGEQLASPAMARRGDVVLLQAETPEGEAHALGVVDETGMAIAVPTAAGAGITRYPVERAVTAWAVG